MKTCTKCKIEKSIQIFSRDRTKKDGFQSHCNTCKRNSDKIWTKANPEKKKNSNKNWRKMNQVKKSEYDSLWCKNNPEKKRIKDSRFRRLNPNKANAKTAKHRAAKLLRTPPWLTKLHLQQIQIFYDSAHALAKEFSIPMEVDHIVPLQGENVSGLHVPWNLQVIPAIENRRKGNHV
jgi:hypothetical protein